MRGLLLHTQTQWASASDVPTGAFFAGGAFLPRETSRKQRVAHHERAHLLDGFDRYCRCWFKCFSSASSTAATDGWVNRRGK